MNDDRRFSGPALTVWFNCLLLLITAQVARAGIGDIDASGWTVLTPSSDSVLVYVSSTDGNDANDGLSPATPKQTIDAANALIRDGYPDWMLLKRGDTFAEGNLGRWKSGRSAAEPLVLTYYGTAGPRPLIKITKPFVDWSGQARNHTAYLGLDLYCSVSDPNSPDFNNTSTEVAFRFVPSANDTYNVLVEDCRLRFCGLLTQGSFSTENFIYNAQHRRNIVTDMWGHNTDESNVERPSGIFISKVVGMVLEENIFHHNGWNEDVPDAGANQYNHNIYFSSLNDGPILVRGNVLSYGSAQGLQLRSGGTAEMNAFIGNAIGMNIGYFSLPTYYTGNTIVRDNVVTDGRPQVPDDTTNPQTGAIWGIWKMLINNTTVDDNIVANIADDRGGSMLPFNGLTANELGTGNIAWDWVQQNNPAIDPGWLDPTRNADSFAISRGLADYDAWLALALARPIHTMPFDLTAYSYNNYIRAGFNKGAVTPPYTYDSGLGGGGGPVAVTGVAVSPGSADLLVTDTVALALSVLPSNATDQSVSWSTANTAVATVDATGLVTAVGAGTTVVTATTNDGGFQDSSSITVQDFGANLALNQPVDASGGTDVAYRLVDGSTDGADRWSAEIFPQSAEIDLGANFQLDLARVFPFENRDYHYQILVTPDGSNTPVLAVDRSSNTEMASVLADATNVTGRYVMIVVSGAATYTGTWCSLNELEVYGSPAGNAGGGETFANLSASTTAFTNGSYTGDNSEAWVYTSTIRIDSGITGATAELRRYTGVLETTLSDGVEELTFRLRSLDGYQPQSAKVEVFINSVSQGVFQPDTASTVKEITLAGLNHTGPTILRFESIGNYQVWVDDISWTTVGAIAVTGVSVTPSTATLDIGNGVQLSATVSPANATNASVTWSSDTTAVATIDVAGYVTAVAGGTALITATTDDGSFIDSSVITVNTPGGVESFANLNASTTAFSGGTYTGDSGETWSYESTTRIASGITGVTAELRRYTGTLETILPDGLDELTFHLRSLDGYQPQSAKIELFIDSISLGIFQPDTASTVKVIDLTGLGQSGPTVLRFESIGNYQAWLDNIVWQ